MVIERAHRLRSERGKIRWGCMLWLVIAGGIPLIITTLGFTFLGEALRDVFDPKLKKDR